MTNRNLNIRIAKIIAPVVGVLLFATPAFAQTPDDYGIAAAGTYCPTLSITMQRGARDISTNNQVSELQKFLADYYDIDPTKLVTGYFGRITQGYVIQFQREQGLPTFGIAGQLTRAAIARVCNQTPSVQTNAQPQTTSTQNTTQANIQTTPNTTTNTAPSTSYIAPTTNSPKISVTYPNGGEQLSAGQGKDVDFRITWTSSNLSGTAYVYLAAADGRVCLLGSAPVSQGNFAVTYGNYKCQNTSAMLASGQYKVSVETDTQLASGKSVNDQGDGYFTLPVAQLPPSISYIYPTTSSGKDVDRVAIYGSNFLLTGKGASVYIDLLQNGSIKQRLSSTDSPMTIFAGSYLTPPDSSGTRMEVRINNANLGPGTYQLRATTDSGASNMADYTVQ